MSISSEITRITNAVANAYTEAEGKGAEMPASLTVANLAQTIASISGGGGLPSGIKAVDFGNVVVSSDISSTPQTYTHNLGVTPDFILVYAPSNVAVTYSMLFTMRGSFLGYRSEAYNLYLAYHSNSNVNVTVSASPSTVYGVSNLTKTSFTLASSGNSYYWRAGTYKYIALKFS